MLEERFIVKGKEVRDGRNCVWVFFLNYIVGGKVNKSKWKFNFFEGFLRLVIVMINGGIFWFSSYIFW